MRTFLLGTSALLTLRDDEPGADRVAYLLAQAQQGKANVVACFVSLMEVLYRVWRDAGETAGRLAYEQCLALPQRAMLATALRGRCWFYTVRMVRLDRRVRLYRRAAMVAGLNCP